jgi:hypothetical protein
MEKMDFDIGNILYIVITLVVVIVGLLGKKRKKPVRTGTGQAETGSEDHPGFLESFEKILNMDQQEISGMVTATDEPVISSGRDEPEEAEPVEEVLSEGMSDLPDYRAEYERVIGRQDKLAGDITQMAGDDADAPLEVIHLDEEEGTDYFEIIKDFDAGAAVVYSAIINRLDY